MPPFVQNFITKNIDFFGLKSMRASYIFIVDWVLGNQGALLKDCSVLA